MKRRKMDRNFALAFLIKITFKLFLNDFCHKKGLLKEKGIFVTVLEQQSCFTGIRTQAYHATTCRMLK